MNEDRLEFVEKKMIPPDDVARIKIALGSGDDSDQRYSMRGLFGVMTAVALVLGVGIRLPPPIFAGIAGFSTLAGMAILSRIHSPPLVLHIGWWMLLAIYLLAMGMAIWG